MSNEKVFYLVIPTLTVGGAESVLVQTYAELKKNGHQVRVILLKDQVEINAVAEDDILLKSTLLEFIMFVFKERHNGYFYSFLERANLFNFIAYIFTHSNATLSVHTAPKMGFKVRGLANQILIKLMYSLAAKTRVKTLVVSKGIADDLNEMYGLSNVAVIPNFIQLDDLDIIASKNTESPITVSFIGRLSPVKGADILVDALTLIKAQLSTRKIQVTIIGDGSERAGLELQSQQHNLGDIINFVGKVNRNDVTTYLSQSDYVVVPSYAEGFGMVVLEALKSHCHLIYSRCDFGPRDILENEFNFLTAYPFTDPSRDRNKAIGELADILLNIEKKMYNDVEVKEIHRVLHDKFSPDVVIKQIINYVSS